MPKIDSSLSIYLQDVFQARKIKNARYSMRAFARDLGLSPGWLSDIFAGRRLPGKQLTQRIASSLKLSHEESQKLKQLIERHRLLKHEKGDAYLLTADQFASIADRENFVLLNLINTADFRSDTGWIAARMEISEFLVKKSLTRLQRLGLITEEKGRYKTQHPSLTTSHDVPSQAIREYHRQVLQHSTDSLFYDDLDFRDITSMTIPVNIHKLEEAKKLIRIFRRKLANLLECGDKIEVYHLNIQLVPATKPLKKGKHLE